jgi:hypothetical protein
VDGFLRSRDGFGGGELIGVLGIVVEGASFVDANRSVAACCVVDHKNGVSPSETAIDADCVSGPARALSSAHSAEIGHVEGTAAPKRSRQ